MDLDSIARLAALLVLAWAAAMHRTRAVSPVACAMPPHQTRRRHSMSWIAAPAASPIHATRLALGEWGVIEGQEPVWPASRPQERDHFPTRPKESPAPGRPAHKTPEVETPGRWN